MPEIEPGVQNAINILGVTREQLSGELETYKKEYHAPDQKSKI